MYEETWSQPLVNYGQQGSFLEQATPPAAGPDQGTLVQLPCVNEDWLPLILGALDQLRNPSSWLDSLTDAQRYDVLGQVDRLRQMVGTVINTPCCNVELRLQNCVLQSSTDGGATWVDVTNWSADFADCVRQSIPSPPPLIGPGPTAQYACNLAGFLAAEMIDIAITLLYNDFTASKTLLQYAADASQALFAEVLPYTNLFVQAVNIVWGEINSGNESDYHTASTDPVLLSQLTCAIYDAIKTDGRVTSGNYLDILNNVCSITYVFADVKSALCDFMTTVGVANLEAMQVVGALDTVDCTNCATWCQKWDFLASASGWSQFNSGSWTSGVGWVSATRLGQEELSIVIGPVSPWFMTDIVVQFSTNFASGGAQRHIFGYQSGSNYGGADVFPGSCTSPCTSGWHGMNHLTDELVIRLENATPGHTITIESIEIAGTGTPPSGLTTVACTYPWH